MWLQTQYFKFRQRFNFSPHRFEIGNPIFQNRALADNFFLLKIYTLPNSDFGDYYNFHLSNFLKNHLKQEELFFNHVTGIVSDRIRYYKQKDPFSAGYAKAMKSVEKLEAFRGFLKTCDQWHRSNAFENVIAEKDRKIVELEARVGELEMKLREVARYDAGEKIVISKGGLVSFIYLIHQIQELVLPNENKLVRAQTQSPWYKLIARYFKHGEKDVSIDTARNYFPAQKDDKPAKFIEIADKDRIFKITSCSNDSKEDQI